MSFETSDLVLATVFFVLGWVAHIVWDLILDAILEATGHASSFLWDLFAVVGIVAACAGIGWAVT